MEDLSELMEAVKDYKWGRSGASLLAINAEIRKILGHPEHLANLEAALVGVLQSDASLAAKRGVCKRLGLIATERSVAVLAGMLTDAATSDMARYSLERIPSDAVDAALRNALPRTQGRIRVGIINSLGNREDSQAVGALGKLLDDTEDEVAQAAAWALGRIGGAPAIGLLSAHRDDDRRRVRLEVLDASLVCARRLASQGKGAEALSIYNELNREGMPSPVRRAASLGIEAARG